MRRLVRPLIACLVVAGGACGAATGEAATAATPAPFVKGLVNDAFIADLRKHLKLEVVRLSVESQNLNRAGAGPGEAERLDQVWRAELKAEIKPLIATTLSNPLSAYLTRVQAHSYGVLTEIIVMDDHGLNVGQSNITSDYWQGDEAKWLRTYPNGADAVFVDEPEWDDTLSTWRVQVNLSIPDASGSKAIGAATFEINLTELQRRSATR